MDLDLFMGGWSGVSSCAYGEGSVVAAFRMAGVETAFEWNPGNHFADESLRTAKGIAWAVGR